MSQSSSTLVGHDAHLWTESGDDVYRSSGSVGIGTTAPDELLHVEAGSPFIQLEATTNGGTAGIKYVDNGGTHRFTTGFDDTTNTYRIAVGDGLTTTPVTVDSSGNCGIGTAVPSDMLELSGSSPEIRLTDSDLTNTYSVLSGNGGHVSIQADPADQTSASRITMEVDGSEAMRIGSSGLVTVKNASNAEISTTHTTGTCDLSTSNNFRIGMSGSAITINLTNATNGQSGVIKIVHDGSAMSFTADQIKWVGGTDPTPSSTNGDIDLIAYYKDNDELYGTYLKGMAY